MMAYSSSEMERSMEAYFDRLWPICRSITGNGVRDTLKILSEIIPLELYEIPSGTKVFDWTVPQEWNISEAYIITPDGKRFCDLNDNNLHVVGYSIPVNAEMDWEELAPHLHTRIDLPEAIPYLTGYYKRDWGFCLSHSEWEKLPRDGKYKVVINSSLTGGSLTIAEAFLPGKSSTEILFSTYLCHPSMANNELSGPLVAAFLYKLLAEKKDRYYSYRFAFTTETIGTLSYLHLKGKHFAEKLVAGFVLTCCGDRGEFTYKRSRQGNSFADQSVLAAFERNGVPIRVRDFEPWGSDERQYCSPGFDLPVGVFMRTPFQEYKEYHTSLDNREFISFAAMEESVHQLLNVISEIETERIYRTLVPFGEPQLGRRGLYENLGETREQSEKLKLRLRLLNFCDGKNTVTSFCRKYDYKKEEVEEELKRLTAAQLLQMI